jgi:hypothetical protein
MGMRIVKIRTPAGHCIGAGNPVPACTVRHFYFDTWTQFQSEWISSIASSVRTLHAYLGGIDSSVFTTAVLGVSMTACPGSEVGFTINGTVKYPGFLAGGPSVLTVCLAGDTGPGTSGELANDLGEPGLTIQTATIDSTTSTLTMG